MGHRQQPPNHNLALPRLCCFTITDSTAPLRHCAHPDWTCCVGMSAYVPLSRVHYIHYTVNIRTASCNICQCSD